MTNEWNEFLAYTGQPVYTLENKKSTAFLGRFTSDMIREFSGFSRVFTILARGYLFHNPDGSIKSGDPYERIDGARRFLSAWCSIPMKKGARKKPAPDADWQFGTDFGYLHEEFPEIVDEDGMGWFCRHVHALSVFIGEHREEVNKRLLPLSERLDAWDDEWRGKVIHYQVPLFSEKTKAEWSLSFDSAIADALELGALRTEEYVLPKELTARLNAMKPDALPDNILPTLATYYLANRQPDSEWVVLPVTNMEAYLGSTSLSRQYLPMIPKELMERKTTALGVSVYKMNL